MSKRRRRIKLPEGEFTVSIRSLSHEGRGIGEIADKTTFIFNSLPNEVVKCTFNRTFGRYNEAETTEVIEPSPDRVSPKCQHFGQCGGCCLQHLAPEQQIKHKEKTLLELLKHQGQCEPERVLPPLTADTWGYRRKARIGVRHIPKKNKVLVGFRERNGRYIADLHQCEVLHPAIGKKIAALSECFGKLNAKDHIAQLEIAITDEVSALILRHLVPLDSDDLNLLKSFCETHHFRLYLQPKGIDSIHVIYPENAPTLLDYEIPSEQLKLQFHPAQFTQINQPINLKMITQAIELLELQKDDQVLDLFCGIGNFTLPLARHCQQITGVEGDATAVAMAKKNATLNHIMNAEFFTANLFETEQHPTWLNRHYDKLLLDPPRSGAKEIMPQLKIWQPKRIVYVSCNPATLARDAHMICEQDYRLAAAGIMDMFPHTQHVEAMCLFIRDEQ